MNNIVEISLKGLLSIISKRKLTFIITVIIILISGLAYTFLVSPEYSSSSIVTLKDNEMYYSDEFYEYMPEVADSLYIIPSYKDDQEIYFIVDKIDILPEELKSEYVLSNTVKALGNKINSHEVVKSLNTELDRWNGRLIFTTYAKTPQLAYELNVNLLKYLKEYKKIQLYKAYDNALAALDSEILSRQDFIDSLNKNDLSRDNNALTSEENDKIVEYSTLLKIRENLLENKEFYIDIIKIIEYPDLANVRNESNYLRNILLSLVAALFTGIIAVFTVNYFKMNKKPEK